MSVAVKLWRAKDYVTTNTGLYNPLLSPHDAALALGEVTQACEPKPVVWYIPDELTALEFTGPIIETSADFESEFRASTTAKGSTRLKRRCNRCWTARNA